MLRSRLLLAAVLCAAASAPLPAAARLLVKNATLVTLDDAHPAPFTGYLLVGDAGRIEAIGPGAPPAGLSPTDEYDAAGKIVLPGFLSGHSHLWQSAFRGIAADQLVREWVQRLHLVYGPHFGPGDMRAFTLHGALDYLRHGITTTYNYSQNTGLPPALYEEQFQAELEAGGRFIFGYALKHHPPLETVRANFEAFLARVRAMPPNPLLLKVSLASDGARYGAAYTQFEFDVMRAHGLDLQMHYLEPPNTREADQAAFAWIEAAGGLGPRLTFAHFIHVTDEILEKSARAGAGMIWNPLSNGRLASGLADIPAYQRAGLGVGMGLDGQASADLSDPFENMRMGLYGLRMKYQSAAVMQPVDVLKLHTIGTARTLGVADHVGTLTPGKFADFLVVDPADPSTGPVSDVYATLVFACSLANLERVYVGGEWVVERGYPRKHDARAVAAEVRQRVDAVRERTAAARTAKGAP